MSHRNVVVLLGTLVAAITLAAAPAGAQSVNDAVADLQQNNVTFEDGAPGLTQNELARLDAAAARLQSNGEYFKVVVLSAPVDDFDAPREFAESIGTRLGGNGRVLVFDTDRVGIASTLDSSAEIERAEEEAAAEANRSQSYADGVTAAAQVLGVEGSSSSGGGSDGGDGSSESESGGGGGSGLIWVVVVVGLLAVGGFVLYRMFKKSKGGGGGGSTVTLGEGEMKVRQEVDKAGNLVLEMADRVEMAGAPPEAKQLFQQGAAEFADLQDDLEAADTRPELEAVYPRIVDSVWKLESAKALTEGQPAPAQPEPGLLFPPPAAPPPPAPGAAAAPLGAADLGPVAPPANYRSSGPSPWLTTAATAALTMLMSRSMAPQRQYRPPASDDFFLGGGSSGGGRRRSGGGGSINLSGGSSGRGMGRRR